MTSQQSPIYPWQESQWQHFKTTRDADHLSHALLLSGSDGIGKNTFAEALANSLLCENNDDSGYACGECKSCKVKQSNAHPDYKYVGLPEGKQQIPVKAIRDLMEFLFLSRSYGGYRVVMISSADKMNINAANSLLKSLEEPPPKTVIILVADALNKLPVTIRSRCQLMAMTRPDTATALAWLEQQGLKNPAENMLSLADDKPLLAKTLDSDEAFLTERNHFAKDLLSVLQQRSSVTAIAKNWEKADHNQLLNWQLKWVIAVVKMTAVKEESTVNKFLNQIKISIANPESIWKLYTDLLHLKSLTDYPLNRLIFTEAMLLLWRDIGSPQ